MLLSLVNKETALAFLIGQPLGGGVDRTEGWEEGNESVTMILRPERDAG